MYFIENSALMTKNQKLNRVRFATAIALKSNIIKLRFNINLNQSTRDHEPKCHDTYGSSYKKHKKEYYKWTIAPNPTQEINFCHNLNYIQYCLMFKILLGPTFDDGEGTKFNIQAKNVDLDTIYEPKRFTSLTIMDACRRFFCQQIFTTLI